MWLDFFNQVLKLPMLAFKRILLNPMGVFIYGILAKWYVIIAIAAIAVTYWVFKGLEQAGVLRAIEVKVQEGLWDARSVAQNCVPKILHLSEMWNCITNLPEYKPSKEEIYLHDQLKGDAASTIPALDDKKSANPFDSTQDYNPYSE
ncbi:MAG: hypothetical protein RLZZ59_429 [Pseudomonadota bacterium]|jgi:hypothetical protein